MNMTESFDSINAPQFVDFNSELQYDEEADSYFEVDHESERINLDVEEVEHYYSPMPLTTPAHSEKDPLAINISNDSYEEQETERTKLRRSMSVGNLQLQQEKFRKDEISNLCKHVEEVEINGCSESENEAPKRTNGHRFSSESESHSKSTSKLTKRWLSKEHIDKLAQPKRRQYSSDQNLAVKKGYVSVAEYVNKFQNSTPERFRSKPKFLQLKRTIPQSPALLTKVRSRPNTALSQEEREKIEFENIQKFKIKANPINKKALQGPLKPTVPIVKKPSTVPEPFKLTKPPAKKMPTPKKETVEFHARPVPKCVKEPPKYKELPKKLTAPETPTFVRRLAKETKETGENTKEDKQDKPFHATRTQVVPFSFEERDKRLQKKKEELINKVLEEERKAREFHARPIPKSIKLAKQNSLQKLDRSSSSGSSARGASNENLAAVHVFKPRPPTVLYKEPFVPVKEHKPLPEIKPFQLSTEHRAKEREEFEQQKRSKEERLEYLKRVAEEEQLRKEEEEKARLRKQTEYKAKPIRKYKEVIIQPSGKVTEPISPNFATDRLRNKENVPQNRNSSC